MTVSAAQERANKKYAEKNRRHRNYLSSRSAARTFIRKYANEDDIQDLVNLMDKRGFKVIYKRKEITKEMILKAYTTYFNHLSEHDVNAIQRQIKQNGVQTEWEKIQLLIKRYKKSNGS